MITTLTMQLILIKKIRLQQRLDLHVLIKLEFVFTHQTKISSCKSYYEEANSHLFRVWKCAITSLTVSKHRPMLQETLLCTSYKITCN